MQHLSNTIESPWLGAPRRQAAGRGAAGSRNPSPAGGLGDSEGPRISGAANDIDVPLVLVVEDEAPVRFVAVETLTDAGFRVIEAEDAAAALQLLASGILPNVMVTDVRMPGAIDGSALAHIVTKRWPDIRIVICSGHAWPGDLDLPTGARFLPKPYLPAVLAGEVAGLAGAGPTEF